MFTLKKLLNEINDCIGILFETNCIKVKQF